MLFEIGHNVLTSKKTQWKNLNSALKKEQSALQAESTEMHWSSITKKQINKKHKWAYKHLYQIEVGNWVSIVSDNRHPTIYSIHSFIYSSLSVRKTKKKTKITNDKMQVFSKVALWTMYFINARTGTRR